MPNNTSDTSNEISNNFWFVKVIQNFQNQFLKTLESFFTLNAEGSSEEV